ncbi:MAG: hypothetical protein IPI73_31015 [Betaproteobacteria bacterium]|nr:hypothetical protein [Betaproteobacteria bacterium]
MRPSKLKQIWNEGQTATMGWVSVANTFTTEVMARQDSTRCASTCGTAPPMSDLVPMLQAVSRTDATPVAVRCRGTTRVIMKALALGAYAIIVPLVNTAAEAAKAVSACRYPPPATRSSGPVRCVHNGGADYCLRPMARSSSWR